MIYLVLLKNSADQWAFAYDGHFFGGEDREKVLTMIPNDFNGYHAAGTVWSASAAISHMVCRKYIGEFRDMDHVQSLLEQPFRGTNFGGFGNSNPGVAISADKFAEIDGLLVKETKLMTSELGPATKPFYESS